jgi:hypothetical protein
MLRSNMRDEAEHFCSLIDGADSRGRKDFVDALVVSIASLVAAALRLPGVSPTERDLPHGPSQDEWKDRFDAIQIALDDWDPYWTTLTVIDGFDAPEAVLLTLADGLADIWRDLKRGLLALDAGAPNQDVIWDWRYGFYTHWGRHATEALRALHPHLLD